MWSLSRVEEAEAMEDEPPSDLEEEEENSLPLPNSKQPVASTSNLSRPRMILEEEDVPMDIEYEDGVEVEKVSIRPGVKEGKRRMALEVEDGFEDDENDTNNSIPQGRGEFYLSS